MSDSEIVYGCVRIHMCLNEWMYVRRVFVHARVCIWTCIDAFADTICVCGCECMSDRQRVCVCVVCLSEMFFFWLWLGLVRTYMHVWIYSIYIYLYEYMRCLQQSTHSQAVSVWEFRFLSDFITITKRTYCSRSHTIQQTVISIFHPMRTQFEVICNNAICILQA